ncbi:hypothetical protein TPA0909_06750 [Streptomyces albus]|nr:hypothetical protein TPA0909_06750 [Streptomyces albus]
MFGSMLDMLDWPRDKRIEWQLGQLLFSLEKPSPALGRFVWISWSLVRVCR